MVAASAKTLARLEAVAALDDRLHELAGAIPRGTLSPMMHAVADLRRVCITDNNSEQHFYFEVLRQAYESQDIESSRLWKNAYITLAALFVPDPHLRTAFDAIKAKALW